MEYGEIWKLCGDLESVFTSLEHCNGCGNIVQKKGEHCVGGGLGTVVKSVQHCGVREMLWRA